DGDRAPGQCGIGRSSEHRGREVGTREDSGRGRAGGQHRIAAQTTRIVTVDPFSASPPPPGREARTSSIGPPRKVCTSTVKPAVSSFFSAAALVRRSTYGTISISGPLEPVGVTDSPRQSVPLAGHWLMTEHFST